MHARKLVAALTFLAAAACTDETGPNISGLDGLSIEKVLVSPSSLTILIPDTITAAHEVQYSAAALVRSGALQTGVPFAWRTSDPSIATVDSLGVVTPVRPGTVEIHASAHKIGKATLEILPATNSVVVSPVRDTIFVDEPILASRDTIRLTAQAFDPLGAPLTGVAFTWGSSAASVVSVDPDGTVRAAGLGTANVTATANGFTAGTQVDVLPLVASLTLMSPPTEVLALDTVQLVAVARDYNNAIVSRKFNYMSSNTSVATVDSTGSVRIVSVGQATITARTAFRTASVNITAFERRLVAMDAGADFTCGFTALGRGYCWGRSTVGQTAATADSTCFPDLNTAEGCILPPKRMNRPELSFTTISAGGEFACGIATDQHLYCWGSDEVGQIGNGQDGAGETPSLATVQNQRFSAVSAGSRHACALNLVGAAYCWGDDTFGQLGDSRRIHSTTPIPISETSLRFRAISAGDRHTCAVTTSGQAWCWGDGVQGQLGNGSGTLSEVPVPVAGGQNFVSISAGGSHTCAIDASGNAFCWGNSNRGQIGNGSQGIFQLVPALVAGGSGYTAISAGTMHTCGIAGGQVRCWGGSDWGQLGDGVPNVHTILTPSAVPGLTAASISVGDTHSCAMTTDGQSWCWGSNRWGALGNELQAAIRALPQLIARPR
jgi:alpha-tubulin suppressor-like RCC1 family protein